MGLIDILVLVTFGISIAAALYRGLVKELLGIISWILAGLGALYGFSFVKPLFKLFIDNDLGADIAAAVTIALIVLIALTIFNAKVTSKLRNSSLSGLDRILGIAFGIVRAVLLIGVAFMIAKIPFSKEQVAEVSRNNFSMPYIEQTADLLHKLIPHTWQEDAKETSGKVIDSAKKTGEKAVDKAIKQTKEEVKKKAKEKVAEYTEEQRKSLDDLIEKTVDIKDLKK